LLEDLARPEAFPEPRPARISVVVTHASFVFLTDDTVWKVKRPVDYGFLDYSSLEKRRQSCENEVRLGARLAPDVYLGVEPVFLDAGGFTFCGPGPIVDCAVRMRRLPDADSALARLRAGRLGLAQLGSLCDRLAAFYRSAPRADPFGSPANLRAQIEENLRQSLPFAGRFVSPERLAHIHDWQVAALEAARPILRQRVQEGRIRDGHGDLRLEHVYFPDGPGGAGQPIVIDPIEFNAAFRCQDSALDVAFLVMELEAAGRGELAAYVLSRFAESSGDYGFFPLVDLYVGHRAWVRAKVACFVAADPGTPAEKVIRKQSEAATLFSLADALTSPRPAGGGPLFVVAGTIGAGKSTVAAALGLARRAPVISSDATRKSLAGLAPGTPGGPGLYDVRATARTYREMLHRAELVLRSGREVILDGTFSTPRVRLAARALAARHGRRFLFLAVDADDETLLARLRAREGVAGVVSDARAELLPWFRSQYQPPTELGPDELVPIDGRVSADAIVAGIEARLEAGVEAGVEQAPGRATVTDSRAL
jgi:aminoglycoside phosphotransferase family enzyme/predicted kinase